MEGHEERVVELRREGVAFVKGHPERCHVRWEGVYGRHHVRGITAPLVCNALIHELH